MSSSRNNLENVDDTLEIREANYIILFFAYIYICQMLREILNYFFFSFKIWETSRVYFFCIFYKMYHGN